jgi:hypothetical protein
MSGCFYFFFVCVPFTVVPASSSTENIRLQSSQKSTPIVASQKVNDLLAFPFVFFSPLLLLQFLLIEKRGKEKGGSMTHVFWWPFLMIF